MQEINNLGVKTYVYGEPAMEDEATHKILLKFYEDTKKYAFALESSITKVYNRYYKEIDELCRHQKEGVVIIDGPSNGDIYSRIFFKIIFFNEEQLAIFEKLLFEIDVMIYSKKAEETIRRIKKETAA